MYTKIKIAKLVVILNRMWRISMIQNNNINDCHSSISANTQLSPIYDHSLFNHQTKFNNRIKNTIKIKQNLAKTNLLKILHDLKCPFSAYDTILGWTKSWTYNKLFLKKWAGQNSDFGSDKLKHIHDASKSAYHYYKD